MEYKKRKRERIRKLYELNSYDSDDKTNDVPLLDENNNEELFINNDSIQRKSFKNNLNENKNQNNLLSKKKKF